MPAIFKGLERMESGETVAVLDYPNARTHALRIDNGRRVRDVTHTPHETRLNETDFSGRFGVDFKELSQLPFREDGYPIGEIARTGAGDEKPAAPAAAPAAKPLI